jgi:hypothetical protein
VNVSFYKLVLRVLLTFHVADYFCFSVTMYEEETVTDIFMCHVNRQDAVKLRNCLCLVLQALDKRLFGHQGRHRELNLRSYGHSE